jgi:hypothetical protein
MKAAAVLCPVALAAALLAEARPARADSTISQPGAHPSYAFEAEPHFFFGLPPPGQVAGQGFGPGFRGTVTLLQNGLVKSIDDSVGLGFGADWIAFTNKKASIWVPIVLQWNFWLTQRVSVFGEPGVGFYLGNTTGVRPDISGGARFALTQSIAVTARVGYPAFSLGVSFLL